MAWLVLVISGMLEAVWATALARSDGFTRLGPSLTFGVAVVVSMLGLAHAMRAIPVGTAYAVWVGIGASLTVVYAMATGAEPVSVVKVVLISGLIVCIAGLKLIH
jgi:quaternary ammonium compound-resistance protein SugE